VLGLNRQNPIVGHFVGTGMHGGVIYIRGNVEKHQLGKEAILDKPDSSDEKTLEMYVGDFCQHFGFNLDDVMGGKFIKLTPTSHRPYGKIYAY
jgi:glutamate synthase domain-containing protein 3